jgi:hypothetical protein
VPLVATLTTQQIVQAGLSPAFASAAGGGDRFVPGDNVYVEAVNGSGGAITVTIDSKVASNYGTDVNLAVSVPAGERRRIGPLPAQRFAASDGLGDITYSGVTSLTVGVFAL